MAKGKLFKKPKVVSSKSSQVWATFDEIFDDQGKKINFVACKRSPFLRPYNSAKDGTRNLFKSHICTGPTLKAFLVNRKIELTPTEKKSILSSQTEHICSALSAFNQVEDPAYKKLLNLMIEFGAKYGKFDISNNLYSRTSISNHVNDLYSEIQIKFKTLLQSVSHLKSWAVITDGWTDNVNKNCFIDYSFSVIDSEFDQHVFQFDMVPFDEKKTADNIFENLSSMLHRIGLSVNNANVITDSARNYIKAMKNVNHFKCVCHRLNTAIEIAYSKTVEKSPYFKLVDTQISDLIGFVNRTGKQCKLPIKLKSGCVTRPWRRYTDRSESIFRSFDALSKILHDVISWHVFFSTF